MKSLKRRRNPSAFFKQSPRLPRHQFGLWPWPLAILLLCLVALGAGDGVFSSLVRPVGATRQQPGDDAQGISPGARQQIQALLLEKASRTPEQRKLDSQLIYCLKMHRRENLAAVSPLEVAMEVDSEERTVVDITATLGGELLENLEALGAEVLDVVADYHSIRARVPLEQLEKIASFPEVRFIQPKQEAFTSRSPRRETRLVEPLVGQSLSPGLADRAARVRAYLSAILPSLGASRGLVPLTGSITTQGDVTHKVIDARNTFGINGTGVKIGVISDGVTNLAASQASGDLGPVTVLPGQAGSGDEGTAMLEIIHDLVPGAQLFFATAAGGVARFAQNIRDLRAAGCDIIVDDIFYLTESPFHDGQAPNVVSPTNGALITQAVNEVTAAGALYFASAGNAGNLNDSTAGVWEGDFKDGGTATGPLLGAGRLHDFGGALFNTITASAPFAVTLFWSDPLGASANDYDLFILNSTGTTVLAASTGFQSGTQDPIEIVGPQAAGRRVVIAKFSGADRFLHLNTNRGRLSIATAGQAVGHDTAAGAFSVAATPAAAFGSPPNPVGPFPSPFNSSNQVERFSSDGPRRLFFKPDGTPFTPGNLSLTGGLVRQKPDITAADGVSVTGVGGFPSPFFGTSAAAPHAAAIAALLKSANSSFTNDQIRAALTSTAIDIEAPGTDRDSGAGIIMAFEAAQALGIAPMAALDLGAVTATENPGNRNSFIEPGEGARLTVALKNLGVVDATNITATLTTRTPGVIVTQPGTVSYPNLPAGTGAATMPFTFTLASDAACPLTVVFTLTVHYDGGPSPKELTFSVVTGLPPFTISTTLDAAAPPAGPGVTTATGLQTPRLNRNGIVSACGAAKRFPGISSTGTRRFDSYTFATCPGATSSCITVTLTNACTGSNPALFAAAYSGSFDPNNLAANYLADPGVSNIAGAPSSFSFNVSAGATFVIVVSEVNSGLGIGCNYTLQVSGTCLPCPTPNQLPVAQCQDVTAPAGADCTAHASINNGSFDPDGDPITVTQTPPGPYPLGATSVLLTVTDSKGATAQCTATVTVVDQTPPAITCPANIVTSTDPGQCSAVATYPAPAVSDNCAGAGTPVCTPPAGSVFPQGTTTVTCTVKDAAGNSSNCSFTVTVNDTQAPVIACPANITAIAAKPGDRTAVVNFPAPPVSDNCPGATVVCSPPSGASFPLGATTVTCTASDGAGNQAACSFTVTVWDVSLQDDQRGDLLLFNSFTGEYQYLRCADGMMLKGRGAISRVGCLLILKDDSRVTATLDRCPTLRLNRGHASIRSTPLGPTCFISDSNILNNTGACP